LRKNKPAAPADRRYAGHAPGSPLGDHPGDQQQLRVQPALDGHLLNAGTIRMNLKKKAVPPALSCFVYALFPLFAVKIPLHLMKCKYIALQYR
jgi:hypothetical protein